MSDVRDASAPAMNQQNRTGPNPAGDFIWYELMTTDAEGAKAFYDAVVGWSFGEGAEEFQGYRMINTSDGGVAGGVMPLNAEMQQHGARPTWLGYLNVGDVDAKVASIEAAGGKALMGPMDIPSVGRIAMVADPQGAPFYVMRPIPPEGRENEPEHRLLAHRSGPLRVERAVDQRPGRSAPLLRRAVRLEHRQFHADGRARRIPLHRPPRADPRRDRRDHGRPASPLALLFSGAVVSTAKGTAEATGGQIMTGPMEVPGGDHIIVGIDPQGAEFALVGKA